MLVERYGCFGDHHQAMIGTIAWYRTRRKRWTPAGIGTEFEQRAKAMGASKGVFFHEILDTEVFKHMPTAWCWKPASRLYCTVLSSAPSWRETS